MSIKQYDRIKLKDGRLASVIEILDSDSFLIELDEFFDDKGYYIGKEKDIPVVYVKLDKILSKAS